MSRRGSSRTCQLGGLTPREFNTYPYHAFGIKVLIEVVTERRQVPRSRDPTYAPQPAVSVPGGRCHNGECCSVVYGPHIRKLVSHVFILDNAKRVHPEVLLAQLPDQTHGMPNGLGNDNRSWTAG